VELGQTPKKLVQVPLMEDTVIQRREEGQKGGEILKGHHGIARLEGWKLYLGVSAY